MISYKYYFTLRLRFQDQPLKQCAKIEVNIMALAHLVKIAGQIPLDTQFYQGVQLFLRFEKEPIMWCFHHNLTQRKFIRVFVRTERKEPLCRDSYQHVICIALQPKPSM